MSATPDSTLADRSRTTPISGVSSPNAKPGDLAPVFDAILDRAVCLYEATHRHLFTYDGERLHTCAASVDPR
jgi:hypothetical protein